MTGVRPGGGDAMKRTYSAVEKVCAVLKADAEAGVRHERLEVAPKFFAEVVRELDAMPMWTPMPLKERASLENWLASLPPSHFRSVRVMGVELVPKRKGR